MPGATRQSVLWLLVIGWITADTPTGTLVVPLTNGFLKDPESSLAAVLTRLESHDPVGDADGHCSTSKMPLAQ